MLEAIKVIKADAAPLPAITPFQHNILIQFSNTADLGISYFEDKAYVAMLEMLDMGYLEDRKGAWRVSKKGYAYLDQLKWELGQC